MAIIFETKRLVLEAVKEQNINIVIDIESHPDNCNYLWIGSYQEHLVEINDDKHILALFKEKETLDVVGYCLIRLDKKSNSFELRRIAITKKGIGYGKESMSGLLKYAFEDLKVHRFWLDVYEDNIIGIKLYEKLGFHQDGILRDSDYTNRGYMSQIIYSILENEYQMMNKIEVE